LREIFKILDSGSEALLRGTEGRKSLGGDCRRKGRFLEGKKDRRTGEKTYHYLSYPDEKTTNRIMMKSRRERLNPIPKSERKKEKPDRKP